MGLCDLPKGPGGQPRPAVIRHEWVVLESSGTLVHSPEPCAAPTWSVRARDGVRWKALAQSTTESAPWMLAFSLLCLPALREMPTSLQGVESGARGQVTALFSGFLSAKQGQEQAASRFVRMEGVAGSAASPKAGSVPVLPQGSALGGLPCRPGQASSDRTLKVEGQVRAAGRVLPGVTLYPTRRGPLPSQPPAGNPLPASSWPFGVVGKNPQHLKCFSPKEERLESPSQEHTGLPGNSLVCRWAGMRPPRPSTGGRGSPHSHPQNLHSTPLCPACPGPAWPPPGPHATQLSLDSLQNSSTCPAEHAVLHTDLNCQCLDSTNLTNLFIRET